MLLTLHIDRLAPATYGAVIMHHGVEVTEDKTVHPSIADAIQRSAADVPDGFALFIEPRFAGITCGTLPIREAAQLQCAEDAARQIVSLASELEQAVNSRR